MQKKIYLVFFEIMKIKHFSRYSHSFRPNINCHTALHQIKFVGKLKKIQI